MKRWAAVCIAAAFLLSGCQAQPETVSPSEIQTASSVSGVPIPPDELSGEAAMELVKMTLPRLRDDAYKLQAESSLVFENETYYLFSILRNQKDSWVFCGSTAVHPVNGTVFIYYSETGRLVPWSEDELWGTGVKHTMETVRTYDWNGDFLSDDLSAKLSLSQEDRYSFRFSLLIDTELGSFVLEDLTAQIRNSTATNEMNNAIYEDPAGDFTLQFTFLDKDSVRVQCTGHPFYPEDILPDGIYTRC